MEFVLSLNGDGPSTETNIFKKGMVIRGSSWECSGGMSAERELPIFIIKESIYARENWLSFEIWPCKFVIG